MTYSIVARDPDSGELGVAVQSHWFAVGNVVPWARPGVGAVATQANALVSYGPRILDLIERGVTAADALAQQLAFDNVPQTRQVAAIDGSGRVATHTGEDCIPESGHITGDGVSCQANIMSSRRVWSEMLDAFNGARGPLEERLMAALDAAETAGGDRRGRQSAAILVVPGHGDYWETKVSLRVDDHPEPLEEMRRLLRLNKAYLLAEQCDKLMAAGLHREAAVLYRRSMELAPGSHELLFWAGLTTAEAGDVEAGLVKLREAIALHPDWATVLAQLPAALSASAPLLCELLEITPNRNENDPE